jgi:excisionase family DNA binding protein
MPTSRTKAKDTDRPEHVGAAAKPICRKLFTIEQAADFAGVPMRVICRWIKTRKLRAYVLPTGVRIDEVDLAHLLSCRESKRP